MLFSPGGEPIRAQNFFSVSESDAHMALPLMPFVNVTKEGFESSEDTAGGGEEQAQELSMRRLLILFVLLLLALDGVFVLTSKKYTVSAL